MCELYGCVQGLYTTGCCGVPIKFSSLDDEDPNTGFEALEILEGVVGLITY